MQVQSYHQVHKLKKLIKINTTVKSLSRAINRRKVSNLITNIISYSYEISFKAIYSSSY